MNKSELSIFGIILYFVGIAKLPLAEPHTYTVRDLVVTWLSVRTSVYTHTYTN